MSLHTDSTFRITRDRHGNAYQEDTIDDLVDQSPLVPKLGEEPLLIAVRLAVQSIGYGEPAYRVARRLDLAAIAYAARHTA